MAWEETLSSRSVYDGRVIKLRVDKVRTADGREAEREVVEHSECVAVVAVDGDDNIILVSQYRQPIDKEILEIPAGGIDPGETPEDAVRRELQEEIGYLPGKVDRLGGFYSVPGYGTEYLHLFLATELAPSRLQAEDTDSITVVPVSLADMPELIESGQVCDAKSIAGLYAYMEYRKGS